MNSLFPIVASLCVLFAILVDGAQHHQKGLNDFGRRKVLTAIAPDAIDGSVERPASCDEVHCSGPSICKLTEEGYAECFIDPTAKPEDETASENNENTPPTSCDDVECYGPSRCEITEDGLAECFIDPTVTPEDPNTPGECDETVKCNPAEVCKVFDGVPTCYVPLPQTIEVECPATPPTTGDKCPTELGLCQYNPFWCYGHTELIYTIECKCSTNGKFMCSSKIVTCPPPSEIRPPEPVESDCIECTNDLTPWMVRFDAHCESSEYVLERKCNKDKKWIKNKTCQRSCDRVGKRYDGQEKKCCEPTCVECSDVKTEWMLQNGKDCDSSIFTLKKKCDKDPLWKENEFCKLSCYNYAKPYDDNICCNGNDQGALSA